MTGIYHRIPEKLRPMVISSICLVLLFAVGMATPNSDFFVSIGDYLPAHTLIEMLSVLISLMVFAAAWRSGNWERINRLPLLGGAFLAAALLDAMHALSYPGMPDFITPNSPEKSIDFWLAGRFVAIGSLLALAWVRPSRPTHGPRQQVLISTLTGIAVSVLVFYIVIYHEHALPRTFIPGTGLTATKISLEYVLTGMGLIAFARFVRLAAMRREPFHAWLATAALAFALSEMFFTLYNSVSDLMNIMGHAFKAFGCLAIYLAFFSLQSNRPWWSLAARLRLFAIILVAAFVIEYAIMLALPYLFPEGSHPILEAIADASSMAVLGAITVILAIGRTQARAMRAEYALDHTHDGYCVINAEGRFIDANASLCRMLGYTAKALSSIDVFSLQADGLDEENRLDIPRLAETGHITYVTQFTNRQGEVIDLEISANHLPGAQSFALFLQDITALKRFEKQVDDLAYYDQVTHLPNRRQLMERLDTVLQHCAGNKQYCALLAINLDGFKQLNHARGTEVGDEFLIATAKQLVSHVRDTDTVARIGGDEFVVILEDLGKKAEKALNESRRMAQRLGKAVSTPTQLGDHGEISYQGSACIGITLFADHQEPADVLLRQALIAMHQAKGAHQEAIRYYSEEMQRLVSERVELTEELRSAIKIGTLELHYQPQVDHHDRIIGAEALLRWHHPDKGMLSPAAFITLAEETGLIVPLGRLALHQACRQLRVWRDQNGADDFSLSVNVSAAQFNDRDFVGMVKEELEASGIAPQMLKLELTESMLVEDTHQVIRQMRDLAGLGIRFSMDDFGTGYSSLSYLTSLPLSQLKIDQGFVRDIDTNPNHVAVVRTIINMGQALNLHVIAEGVETEAELDVLKENGCHTYQGFLFSKPLPAKAFTALLRQGKIVRPERV